MNYSDKDKKERQLLEKIFNPYGEPIKNGELTDVDAHWERIEKKCLGKSWHH